MRSSGGGLSGGLTVGAVPRRLSWHGDRAGSGGGAGDAVCAGVLTALNAQNPALATTARTQRLSSASRGVK